jgi:hypothetical protein
MVFLKQKSSMTQNIPTLKTSFKPAFGWLLVMLPVLLLTTGSAFAQTNWDGSADTDWGNPENWSAGVPDGNDDVVILNGPNQPAISGTAVARTVRVDATMTLTIAATGNLTLSGWQNTIQFPRTSSLMVAGTVENNGQITLNGSLNPQTGLYNKGTFNNNAGAVLDISDASSEAIYQDEGTFNNAGKINIGQTGGMIQFGLLNATTFNNKAGGEIVTGKTTDYGLGNGGVFNNEGKISTGADSKNGINNTGTFNNKAGGEIAIEANTDMALANMATGTFTNEAAITIGGSVSAGRFGISNDGLFINAGGVIKTDRTTNALVRNAGTLTNSGKITVNDTRSGTATGISNEGIFNNNTGGELIVEESLVYLPSGTFTNAARMAINASVSTSGAFNNLTGGEIMSRNGMIIRDGVLTNSGEITTGTESIYGSITNEAGFNNQICGKILIRKGNFNNAAGKTATNAGLLRIIDNLANDGSFINDGILKYGQLSGPVTNNHLIVSDKPTPIFSYGSNSDETIEGIFTDDAAIVSAGTFTAPNTFVPNPGTLPGNYVFYAKITMAGNACSHIVPFTYEQLSSDVTWTGAESSEWGNAANWDGGVPVTSSHVIIPNVANDPVIASGAVITVNSFHIRPSGFLRVSTGATLTVGGSKYHDRFSGGVGMYDNGRVDNNGTIIFNPTDGIGKYCLVLGGGNVFNNNSGAVLRVDGATDAGISTNTSTFTNAGRIVIGSVTSTGRYGVENDYGNFNNVAGGDISIDRSTVAGWTGYRGTLTNTGTITIGAIADVGPHGMDRREGAINIRECGKLIVLRGSMLNPTSNGGLLYVTNNLEVDVPFANGGVLRYGGLVGSVENNYLVVRDNPGPTFEYSGYFDGTIDGIYTNAEATVSAGYFAVPNNFEPNETLAPGVQTLYAKISPNGGACAYVVPFTYNVPVLPPGGQTTWTGGESSDWNTAGNWSDGVPGSGTRAIIGDVETNDPVIGVNMQATPKSVLVEPGGALTIQTTGTLTINNTASYTSPFAFSAGLNNQGTVTNNGLIVLGPTKSVGNYAIINQGNFSNNVNAEIRADNSDNTALFNASGTFTNAGKQTIGQNAPVGLHGIWNDATFNNNTGGEILISNTSLRALANNADEFKSIYATFNNAAAINIGATAAAGTVGIRNLARFNNNLGGDIKIDRTTDIGLYNSAGTFTNAADVTIGANSSTGTHGLVNEGIFEQEGTANLWIGRATGSSLYHAAGTFNNASEITIGSGVPGGTTGIESRAAFNNNAGGDIRISGTTEVGLYHIAGTFTNDGDINLGNSSNIGQYGLRNTGEFKNNGGANIIIDGSTTTGLLQTNAEAPAPAFTNAGNLKIGANVAVGADGLENQATFTNTGVGHITIDRSTDIALKTPFGTFTNEAEITIGGAAGVGTYGVVNRSTFSNSGSGHIRIDRSTDTGLYHSSGTFTNDAKITIGANQSPGIHGIFNEGPFNNEDNGDIRIDGSTGSALRNFQHTFTNAGSITTGGASYAGDFGIRNQATFLNNAGGTINADWSHDGIHSQGVFENAGVVKIGAPGKVTVMLTREGGSFNNNTGGIVKGTGAINSLSLTSNGGTLSPGYSPGTLTFNDSHDFTNSILDIEVNGVGTAGTDYDQIAVTGTATLGGKLAVTAGYTPTIGDEITILSATSVSGKFSSVIGLAVGWKVIYESNAVKLYYDDPMPVTLVSFNARAENSIVRLEWRTTSETDNAGFYIERSANGFNWNDIGFVDGNATTSVVKDYTFQDEKPVAGLSYYRLRQMDFDGTTERSRVAAVRFADPEHSVTVWTDAARQAHIKSSEPIEKVTVYDLSGRIIMISKQSTLNLSQAASGIVLVRITTAGGTVVRRIVLF